MPGSPQPTLSMRKIRMFGFLPIFFSSAASFFFAAANWSSCGITGSMFSAICTVSAASGSVMSPASSRSRRFASSIFGKGAAARLPAAMVPAGPAAAAAGWVAMTPPNPASAAPAPTILTKSRRETSMEFLLVDCECCKVVNWPAAYPLVKVANWVADRRPPGCWTGWRARRHQQP